MAIPARVSWRAMLLAAWVPVACASPSELRPFTTDGCSMFPDRAYANSHDWCHCCVVHDLAYWRGGTEGQRLEADRALRSCVYGATHDRALAETMYSGVRMGGMPYWPTWFRWAYGWPYGRTYEALTDEERRRAEELEREYRKGNPELKCES
jgi:hypothetical protein